MPNCSQRKQSSKHPLAKGLLKAPHENNGENGLWTSGKDGKDGSRKLPLLTEPTMIEQINSEGVTPNLNGINRLGKVNKWHFPNNGSGKS